MAARCKLCRTLFTPSLVSCLNYQLLSPSKHQSFRNVDENCAVDVAIGRTGSKSQNRQANNTTLQGFFDLSTFPVSPSGIYGILLLSLMLAMTTAQKTKHYSRRTASFADHRSPFTRAYGAILQSRDFNLRIELARKFFIHEADISKTDQAPYFFQCKQLYYSKGGRTHVRNWSRIPPTWKFSFFLHGLFHNFSCFFFCE